MDSSNSSVIRGVREKLVVVLTRAPKKLFVTVLVIVAISGVSAAGYFYFRLNQINNNSQPTAKQEAQDVVALVATLMVLPEGEEPTVATVTTPEQLKDQPFFANAQAGDKVLIYTNAKKAILYSVSLNKILEVAPLNIGANQ